MISASMCASLARRAAVALGFGLVLASTASAQSILANRGLGLEVQPRSARGASLGGLTLGLASSEVAWANPAGAVGLPAAGLLTAFQYDELSGEHGGQEVSAGAARFPVILAAFPFGPRWAATVGFGSFLDQNWAVQRLDSLVVDGETVRVVDRITSEGGVARIRAAAGARVLPQLSVGLGVDLFTGTVQRVSGRIFPGEGAPRCCAARWDYSGLGVLGSAHWAPNEAFRLAGSASVGGNLEAEPRGTGGEALSYSIPAAVEVGASAQIAPRFLLAAGGDWTGWSSLDEPLARVGGARDAWSLKGGLEWDALQFGVRSLPIRLGGRTRALPFRTAARTDAAWISERALTAGTGLVMGGGGAVVDLGVERGSRSGEVGVNESFWRFNASVSVLGQ
jgi:hypothetical protein